eukprot:3950356-Amphidinium_carterae.1
MERSANVLGLFASPSYLLMISPQFSGWVALQTDTLNQEVTTCLACPGSGAGAGLILVDPHLHNMFASPAAQTTARTGSDLCLVRGTVCAQLATSPRAAAPSQRLSITTGARNPSSCRQKLLSGATWAHWSTKFKCLSWLGAFHMILTRSTS